MPRVEVVPLRLHRGWLVPLTMLLVVGLGRPVCLATQLLLRWWRWGRDPGPAGWRPLFPATLAELSPRRVKRAAAGRKATTDRPRAKESPMGDSDGNDGVKDALKNDWEQTKSDLPGLDGKDQDQDVDDTLKQAAGKEPTDGSQN